LLLTDLIEERVLIWFKFNKEIEYVAEILKKKGVSLDIVIGSMTREERNEKFSLQREGKIRVLLVQIKCARFGVDASHCDTEIYYSNSWSNEDRMQSEERIVHPSKTTPLLIIDYATRGAVDGEVIQALREKKFNTKWLMSSLDTKER
jgi:SNF2 family DNA or RNA helicase